LSATISLAKQETTGVVQHINEVDKQQGFVFICVGCGKEMIVVKSRPRKRDWHFRHAIESNCTGGKDTALHDYAAQILIENEAITIRENLHISYSNPRKEVTVFGKRSDVTVTHENTDVHFEIFVTHDLGQEKIDAYKINKVKCIRIDLSNSELLTASPDAIKEAVLNQQKNKTIIYWNGEPVKVEPKGINWGNIFWGIFAAIGIGYLLKKGFGKSSCRKR
jgi:hypothetical protein